MRLRSSLSCLILLLGAAACQRPAPEPALPLPARGERLSLRESLVADLKPVAGEIATRDMAEARSRLGGALVELRVHAGDPVRRGQLIGRVVDPRIGLETRAYDAQVVAAQADAAKADADLARTRDLFEKGVYAKARLEQVEAASRAAGAGLFAARARRAASAESGAQGAILAPGAGRVVRADVPAGSVVSPGQSIATVATGELIVRLDVPEQQARRLRAGQAVAIAADDLDGRGGGTIAQVYPAAQDGRVRVDIAVPGLQGMLIGQKVRVDLPLGQRPAMLAPERFVIRRSGADYVRLLGADGSASEVPVQLAPAVAPGEVEVLAGLSPGDVIVAPGAAR